MRVNTASEFSGVNTASEFSGVNTGSKLNAMILYTITSDLLQDIKSSYAQDLPLQKIIDELAQGTSVNDKYQWEGGILKRKGKIVVGTNEKLRTTIIQHYHADAVGGHSGTTVTAHKSQGKSIIFVVVDRLSKYAHFMALSHPYTASSMAQAFLDLVYKLDGLPNSIVSDRDNGQTEVVNKCLKCYLRCMTGERPKEWVQWLPLAEFWYNTNRHSSTKVSPYEVVYGQTPHLHTPYVAGESAVESVDRSLQARENAIEMLKFHIKRSHDRMKKYADLKRTKVGLVAYKLDSPSESQVHQVFHVSQLKLCKGNSFKKGLLPHCGDEGLLSVEPEKILDIIIGKVNNRAAVHDLVKWMNHSEEDDTWELAEDLLKRFPDFSLDP
ncbi:reverse transcriptase [Tanacetum coccineum]